LVTDTWPNFFYIGTNGLVLYWDKCLHVMTLFFKNFCMCVCAGACVHACECANVCMCMHTHVHDVKAESEIRAGVTINPLKMKRICFT
jgi:hypothetical protein